MKNLFIKIARSALISVGALFLLFGVVVKAQPPLPKTDVPIITSAFPHAAGGWSINTDYTGTETLHFWVISAACWTANEYYTTDTDIITATHGVTVPMPCSGPAYTIVRRQRPNGLWTQFSDSYGFFVW